MVKASERKKAYHPRGPHKEGCMCAPCKAKRGVGETITLPTEPERTPLPTEVRLDSLASKRRFKLRGEESMVKEHIEGMVVCYNLTLADTMTLGGSTKVEPI